MIPKITDPLGKRWIQPDPKNFVFFVIGVEMSEEDFQMLPEYSRTIPTGVYEGKM